MAIPMTQRCAIIVGASSGIGAALAKLLAGQGYRLALLARRVDRLEALAAQYNQPDGEPRIFTYEHDVTDYAAIPALFDGIVEQLGGLSHIYYVSGVMPAVKMDEYDFEKDRRMVEVNYLGMIAWLNQAADFFQRVRGGVIIGVASVAGDRGRAGQPGYNSSKGAQAIYLESLRNRLDSKGVRVVTIKPGPVESEMSAGLGKMPFMISSEAAAKSIAAAAQRRRGTVYVPGVWRPIMLVIRLIPSFIMRKAGIS